MIGTGETSARLPYVCVSAASDTSNRLSCGMPPRARVTPSTGSLMQWEVRIMNRTRLRGLVTQVAVIALITLAEVAPTSATPGRAEQNPEVIR